ncbi:MAG: mannose-1-phosphate guanylyltransferase/mannose-6-phosphate isomerase [Nitrospirae bacterium]|nr:mannose-1-phosphate guanylyltransferase/mannose-6-phosphate isomerase [Nitrospirota bacterium]
MYAVIMAGGSGTRFWPLSREKMPKQLLKIGSDDTLIQLTVERVLPLVKREHVFIVTNHGLAVDIGTQLISRFGGSWDRNFILEPEAKNTAPALALSALHLNRIDPDGIMVVLSADHAIRSVEAFRTCVTTAAKAAERDYLVTLGIKPNRPETGYGYIKAGEPCPEAGLDGVSRVERFVEKPDLKTAQGYLQSGQYYWNSGMFVWKVRTFLKEIERHMPSLHEGLEQVRKSIGSGTETEAVRSMFAQLHPVSVDYGIMEKTDRAAVVPADIGWSDVGSWTALEEVTDKDAAGNIITGNVIDIDSTDSVIYADKRLVATIGLKDTIVVDTPDATLVCSRDRAQDVKKVVDELKKRKAEERLTHRTVHRPWGNYTILEEGDRYKIKRLVVIPGSKLSHQLHHHRSEHWVVVSGTARVTNGDKEYDVHTNESTYIPMSTKHRLENPGKVPLQIIEVQNGEYLEEDDIVRFDDDYKRHENAKSPLPELPK